MLGEAAVAVGTRRRRLRRRSGRCRPPTPPARPAAGRCWRRSAARGPAARRRRPASTAARARAVERGRQGEVGDGDGEGGAEELPPVGVVVDPLDRARLRRRPLGEPHEGAVPRAARARRTGGRTTAARACAARAASPGPAAAQQAEGVPGRLPHEVHRARLGDVGERAGRRSTAARRPASHARSIQAVATAVGSVILARAGAACGPAAR